MSKMCLMPFSNLVINENGSAAPCCKYDITKENGSLQKKTLYEHNIEDLFYQPEMNNLRDRFLKGEQPSECKLCWEEESAGIKSLRQHRLELASTKAHGKKYFEVEKFPKIVTMDFKFSSLCNLKCRICGPYLSSTWLKESIDLQTYDSNIIKIFSKSSERKFFANNQNFEIFKKILPQLHILEFYGGEPFMQPEHEKLMQILYEYDDIESYKLELFYNTNGTNYDDFLPKVWKKMNSVELNISLDDIGDRFEYQRHPAKWDKVIENIEKFKTNCSKNVNITLYVTLSMYNVFYIDEFLKYNANNFKLPVRFNIVHFPNHMSIIHLPKHIKLEISNKLNSISKDETKYIEKGFGIINILEYMNENEGSTDSFKIFLETTNKHDSYRKESFKKTFFELYNNIMYE